MRRRVGGMCRGGEGESDLARCARVAALQQYVSLKLTDVMGELCRYQRPGPVKGPFQRRVLSCLGPWPWTRAMCVSRLVFRSSHLHSGQTVQASLRPRRACLVGASRLSRPPSSFGRLPPRIAVDVRWIHLLRAVTKSSFRRLKNPRVPTSSSKMPSTSQTSVKSPGRTIQITLCPALLSAAAIEARPQPASEPDREMAAGTTGT